MLERGKDFCLVVVCNFMEAKCRRIKTTNAKSRLPWKGHHKEWKLEGRNQEQRAKFSSALAKGGALAHHYQPRL